LVKETNKGYLFFRLAFKILQIKDTLVEMLILIDCQGEYNEIEMVIQ